MLGDLDWHRFANGDFEHPIRICRLETALVRELGASDDRVFISPQYAPKLVFKHGLTAFHLPLMAICVEFGSVFREQTGRLVFFYDDQSVTGKMLKTVVKTTTERHEIWVQSFYTCRNKDYEKRRLRMEMIRPQN